MSTHGKNCQKKARKNARVKKNWLQRYGSPGRRRWNSPAASQIKLLNQKNLELYGNAHPERRRK